MSVGLWLAVPVCTLVTTHSDGRVVLIMELAILIAADVAILLGLVVAAIKFISSQSARIATTEHRLTTLETQVAELRAAAAETDSAVQRLEIKVAVMEEKIDTLVSGQVRIITLLEARE